MLLSAVCLPDFDKLNLGGMFSSVWLVTAGVSRVVMACVCHVVTACGRKCA